MHPSAKNEILLVHFLMSLLMVVSIEGQDGVGTPAPTVSPITEFIASPRNVTVLEGHPAVLRCKLKDTVHNCQWFYLEAGLDMFDESSAPVLVKEFRPTKSKDCSIKFSEVKPIQSGQWICKGLQIHARKYVVSRPAFLQVIKGEDGETDPQGEQEPEIIDISFRISEEGHIINTKLKDTAILGCNANQGLTACSWIKPDGTTLHFEDGINENYVMEGDYEDGNCSLTITEVASFDEGNWRCVVSVGNNTGGNLGPLIHLHVLEFGAHAEGSSGFAGEKKQDSSLIAILVVTSVVLLGIIIALVCYMYKYVWRKNLPPHRQLDSNESGNIDYSNYGSSTWLPTKEKDQKLIDESTEMRANDENPNDYTRYLDMSGSGKVDGYVAFPDSSKRSSMSSKTTLSTVRVGQNAINDSDESARSSTTESLNSASTFGNPTYDKEIQGRALPMRQVSEYSEGHLYEEIDEMRMRRKADEEAPSYANIDEDNEGYMIPKKCSPNTSIDQCDTSKSESESPRAPPYSKVGENGLVLDADTTTIASNPTYSEGVQEEEPEESYDVPSDPPVPIRIDSIDNPLADYDVPKPTSGEPTLPVFV